MYTKSEPKKISYKFTQFLQGVSIFISVKFTFIDEYCLIVIGSIAAFFGLFFASISIIFLIYMLFITAFTFLVAYAYHTAIKSDIKKEADEHLNLK